MSRYILNPGDYQDVLIVGSASDAKSLLLDSGPQARLYRCFRQGDTPTGRFCWEEYTAMGGWMTISRDNLPIKVLEAGER